MNIENVGKIIERVREKNPLIHNITNTVVANFSANGLLALGASPVMASAIEEVAEMAQAASALVLNMGTLNHEDLEAMIIAGKAANEMGIPVILDPVGVGATTYRTKSAQKIIQEVKVQFIRGNAAEIANLIGEEWKIKGVDVGSSGGNPIELTEKAAQYVQSTVIVTGKTDVVSDGSSTCLISNGHPLLTKVTGSGCLLSAIIGAFAAVEKNSLIAAVSALTFYGVAAEMAAAKTAMRGPGSFQTELINQLSLVTAKEVNQAGSFKLLREE